MKNIPVSTVCRDQYVIVFSDYLYIGIVDMVYASCFSITTTWSNNPIKHSTIYFHADHRDFAIIYKSSFPLDYTDLPDILKDHPELLI